MEVGIVTEESLTTVLRQIGHKRRQGVLELVYSHRLVQISFIQGKIVEVRHGARDVAEEVLLRLQDAGLVPVAFSWFVDPAEPTGQSYRSLYISLVESGYSVDEEFYKNAIKQCLLDRLYDLDLSGNARFQFRVEMVGADREFSPTVSIGQVLLDLVALPSNRERFEKLFPNTDQVRVKRTDNPEGVLTAEEKLISGLLSGSMSVALLQKRVMLSRFYFWGGVLSLFERGLLCIATDAQVLEDKAAVPHDNESPPLRELLKGAVIAGTEAELLIGAITEAAAQAGEVTEAELALRPNLDEESKSAATVAQPEEALPGRGRSERWSLRALESAAAVQIVAILYVVACVTVPWFTWAGIMEYFAH